MINLRNMSLLLAMLLIVMLFQNSAVQSDPLGSIESDTLNIDKFKLYPNPAKDYINIDLSDACTCDLAVKITNSSGEMIYEEENFEDIGLAHVDVSSYACGPYFVNIFDGKKIYSKKFIIKR